MQVRQHAVARDRPRGIGVYVQVAASISALARAGFILHDRAGQLAALRQVQVQRGDAVPLHVALHALVQTGEGALRAVLSALSPSALVGVAGRAQEVLAVLHDGDVHIAEHELALRVGRVKHAAVGAGQRAAGHLKAPLADLRIAGHALVDDDRPRVVVLLQVRHGAAQIAVIEADGIQPLQAQRLGARRAQLGVADGDIRRHIDRGRSDAAGRIGAALDHHRAAAAVGADGRRGLALRRHGQILRIQRAAARDVNAARGVLARRDGHIGYIGHAVAVGEHARAARSIRLNDAVADRDGAARGQDGRADAVKARSVSARAVRGLAHDAGLLHGRRAGRHQHGVFIRSRGADLAGERGVLLHCIHGLIRFGRALRSARPPARHGRGIAALRRHTSLCALRQFGRRRALLHARGRLGRRSLGISRHAGNQHQHGQTDGCKLFHCAYLPLHSP